MTEINREVHPTLDDLSARAAEQYPNADQSVAVIATARSGELTQAITDALVGRIIPDIESDTIVHQLDLHRTHGSTEYDRQEQLRRELGDRLSKFETAKPQADYASELSELRYKLSKPVRWAATGLVSATCALGLGGAIYNAQIPTDKNRQLAQEYKLPEPKVEPVTIGMVAGIGLVGGALIGNTIGQFFLVGSGARIRARRMAKQQEASAC